MKISFLEGLKPTVEQYAQAIAAGAEVVFALSELNLASGNVPFIDLSGIKKKKGENLVSVQLQYWRDKAAGFVTYGKWVPEKRFDALTVVRLDLLVILISQKDEIPDEHLIALRAAKEELKIPIFALNSSGQYKIIGARSKKDKGIIYFNI